MRTSGLTFIELLVVLVIIGTGWFSLVPRLDLAERENKEDLAEVNAFLFQAGQEAIISGAPQQIRLSLGHSQLTWKRQKVELPGTVSRIEINGRHTYGSQPVFALYPTGHIDELSLWLTNGTLLRSRPLAGTLSATIR